MGNITFLILNPNVPPNIRKMIVYSTNKGGERFRSESLFPVGEVSTCGWNPPALSENSSC